MEQQLDALPAKLDKTAKLCQQMLIGYYLANKGAYTKEQVDAAVFKMCVGQ